MYEPNFLAPKSTQVTAWPESSISNGKQVGGTLTLIGLVSALVLLAVLYVIKKRRRAHSNDTKNQNLITEYGYDRISQAF